jgi:hypothetical protein
MQITDLIYDGLSTPSPANAYAVGRRLGTMFPEKAILETEAWNFDLHEFAADGHCLLMQNPEVHNQFTASWSGPPTEQIERQAVNAWFHVSWQGQRLEVLQMELPGGFCGRTYYWILADRQETVDAFFTAVCKWNPQPGREVLVFEGGYFQRSDALLRAIEGVTWETLILPAERKQQLRDDLERFLRSRETYARYGVPWKRGILLTGPPGNGKTHAVKAMLNSVEHPCLYVKSLKARGDTEHGTIREVFRAARRYTPCLLVLEDLDSLIDDENRSFFLNEMDGFASNNGILTIATTNHPDRLDPAILERPSRFDRKYHFDLPAAPERHAFLAFWNERLDPALRVTDCGLEEVAAATEGYSFAYLKELVLSSVMAWIEDGERGKMDEIMPVQAASLREQMQTRPAVDFDAPEETDEE